MTLFESLLKKLDVEPTIHMRTHRYIGLAGEVASIVCDLIFEQDTKRTDCDILQEAERRFYVAHPERQPDMMVPPNSPLLKKEGSNDVS